MNYTERKTANAVGGKTGRACDSCLRKWARWYCAADDAFLCQGCDSLVHSANQLASRHERVRLGTSSNKPSESKTLDNDCVPTWHHGFTRKARTPRHPKPAQKHKERSANVCASPLVPDLGTEDALFEETEAQLLYRVPVLDSFAVELCNVSNESENIHTDYINEPVIRNDDSNVLFSDSGNDDLDNLPVFLPSDMEFAADVESLLGTGLDGESCGMEGLGLIDCKEENDIDDCYEGSKVKIEDDEEVQAIIACHFDPGLDLSRETLDWNFYYESPVTGEEEEEDKVVVVEAEAEMMNGESREMMKKKFLRLNYEEVIVAWDNQGCPWTTGIRPEFNPDDCWPDFMGMNVPPGAYHLYGGAGGRLGSGSDGGREARVSRYREKRRTRLFSKKIRYEVRKLNAEKRPRMKGRFVKRTSFAGGSTNNPTYLMNK